MPRNAQMVKGAFVSNFAGSASDTPSSWPTALAGFAYPDLNSTFSRAAGLNPTRPPSRRSGITGRGWASLTRTKIVGRLRGYHGLTLATMSATGIPMYWHLFEPRVPGFPACQHARSLSLRRRGAAGGDCGHGSGPGIGGTHTKGRSGYHRGLHCRAGCRGGGVVVPPDDYFPAHSRNLRRVRHLADCR